MVKHFEKSAEFEKFFAPSQASIKGFLLSFIEKEDLKGRISCSSLSKRSLSPMQIYRYVKNCYAVMP